MIPKGLELTVKAWQTRLKYVEKYLGWWPHADACNRTWRESEPLVLSFCRTNPKHLHQRYHHQERLEVLTAGLEIQLQHPGSSNSKRLHIPVSCPSAPPFVLASYLTFGGSGRQSFEICGQSGLLLCEKDVCLMSNPFVLFTPV